MSKYVLHGYVDVPEATLLSQLNELQLEPLKVKKLTIKQKRYTDHCVFLIYFKKEDKIKISSLREVTAIEHVRVRWEYYSNRHRGPIQCSNCLLFGHGGNSCHLKPRCIRCGSQHKSMECPLLIDNKTMTTRTKIPEKELKCANCGQRHTANYSKCETRQQFIERRNRYRQNTQHKAPATQNIFQPAPQLDNFNFPRIRPQKIQQNPQHSNQLIQNSPGDLFGPAELMEIFKEMMEKMQAASSKLQQISVLGEIVIKYASR